jgi:hypothetical protein
MSWIDTLSDSELRQRLEHRGMPPEDAASWVAYRETPGGHQVLAEILGEDVDEED